MNLTDSLYDELKEYARLNRIPIIRDESLELLLDEVKKKKPRSILEIGTAIGYSGTKMLEASPEAKLYTIEIDPVSADIARETFKRAGVYDRVVLWEGDCVEIVAYLEGKYDFIFLDGPKAHYLEMLPYLTECMNSGGVLFSDNVFFYGYVEQDTVYNKKKTIIRNMRKYLEALKNDDRLVTELIKNGDGVAISVKR